MGWVAHIGGRDVALDDLPIEVLEQAEAVSGVPGFQLMVAPLGTVAGTKALIPILAKHAGVDLPADLTPRAMYDMFDRQDVDTVPTVYADGGIPDPKAPEPEGSTSGSPGVPSPSDGPPT